MGKFDDLDFDELEQLTDENIAEQLADEVNTFVQNQTPTISNVQKYTHCEMCGGRLHFNYITDFSRNSTQEKASCPECGLETRQVLHRLQ